MAVLNVSWAFLVYALAYGLAALSCGVAVLRAREISDRDTRRGLVSLLLVSGAWAALELTFLAAPTPAAKYGTYVLSLIVGLSTVGAWLYFCSAYTGRTFHRTPFYRRTALAVYLGIVAVKLTNPLHGLYFQTAFVQTPFPHLSIIHGAFHWVVSGLSYALVAVGFFMLYEQFLEADFETRPLAGVVAVTVLPVGIDLLAVASDSLIDINYEPLGVAVFAVGILYLFEEEFLAVKLTDGVDDPVIYLDDGEIRQYNGLAERLFPGLSGAVGDPLESAVPDVAAALERDPQILERERDGERAYYLLSATTFTLGGVSDGRMIVCSDVTETETQRRELARQNEQLEGFAAAVRHELLNTLQILSARVDIAEEAIEGDELSMATESLHTASVTTDRMTDIVDDLATLARYGQTVEPTAITRVGLADIVETAWDAAETGSMAYSVEGDASVAADPERLKALFVSGFRFAAHNGATEVTVSVTDDGFVIRDDGAPAGDNPPEAFFEYGSAIPDAEAGLHLPNLRMLAQTHGWAATLDTASEDGISVVVTGISSLRADQTGTDGADGTTEA